MGGGGGTMTPDCAPATVDSACGKSTDCKLVACTKGKCDVMTLAAGTKCASDGGELCDGKGQCVPATCMDMFRGGKESDVDCGGICPPCDNDKKCNLASDCKSGYCNSGSMGSGGAGGMGGMSAGGMAGAGGGTPGKCAACTKLSDCPSGLWCNKGTCDKPQDSGKPCMDGSECANGICVDGFCCDKKCDGLCESCAAMDTGDKDGSCAPVKANTDPKGECTKDDKACIEATCSGAAGACKPAATSVVCRTGSGDSCDPDEKCTGTVGAGCPAEVVASSATVCRKGSGDLCDPDEKCTGVATQKCPTDVVENNQKVCRAGSGDACDPDEKCTGTAGQKCPTDVVENNQKVCRLGSGDACDPDEKCTGNAGSMCPTDVLENTGEKGIT